MDLTFDIPSPKVWGLAALLFLSSSHTLAEASAAEPALPTGLGGTSTSEPSLPAGLGDPEKEKGAQSLGAPSFWDNVELGGFYEMRYGRRVENIGSYKNSTLGEARLQVDTSWTGDMVTFSLTADALLEKVVDDKAIELEEGRGWVDLREASIFVSPLDNLDLKVGRQILTWGTGDLIFINDLFPKDWNSFFIGRDDEYLKAPSDAVKTSIYFGPLTIDAVYTPKFDSDRYLDGRRLTYFSPMTGGVIETPTDISVSQRDKWGDDAELALRLSGQAKSIEWALYGYDGYWKSPVGFDPFTGENTFPGLRVYGASLRGPALGGIANAEIGYYDAVDSGAAADPFLPNSEWRFLAGFEREIVTDLTGAAQVYLEKMEDYSAYQAALPPGMPAKEELRSLVTLRLTKMAMNQNLMLSAFNFYSPSDEDGYLRVKATYKLSDAWAIEGGANLFYGEETSSFFGQFEDNTNLFVSLRMSF